MKIYRDANKKFFGLLYIQNERAVPGEPTWWFQPMQIKKRGRIPEKFEKIPGAWPVPLAQNLVPRVLAEFHGSISDAAEVPVEKAEPKKKRIGSDEETE